MSETYTDKLQQKAYEAEERGSEVEYHWHDEYNVLRFIEIDGEEFENPEYEDEVTDAHWTADSYQVAERYWRS